MTPRVLFAYPVSLFHVNMWTITPFFCALHLVPSDLAAVEREAVVGFPRFGARKTHLHTPTHTVFHCIRCSPGRHVPLASVSLLSARTLRNRPRITRAVRVRAPSGENRSFVQSTTFSLLRRVFYSPELSTQTHVYPLYLSDCNQDCHAHLIWLCSCVFLNSLSLLEVVHRTLDPIAGFSG